MTTLLLTKENVTLISKKLDEAFDFNEIIKNPLVGGALEAGDGPLWRFVLTQLNVAVSAKIPDTYEGYVDELNEAIADVFDGDEDYADAIDNALEIVDGIITAFAMAPWLESSVTALLELVKVVLHYLDEREK